MVAHLHGGDTQYLSDGLPDAWGTPNADANAPANQRGAGFQQGRLYSKPYTYDNTQEAGHLWYHDHALGVTRTNVYMGLAGHYFIRDAQRTVAGRPGQAAVVAVRSAAA
ncbi:MAG: multicopper oxidase domain-containing protein [Comamonadaceae bacterium]|nr:multicopper oxidase domain-containing protein [Comamonadaceae bacterium]